jgi:hypothetical protein
MWVSASAPGSCCDSSSVRWYSREVPVVSRCEGAARRAEGASPLRPGGVYICWSGVYARRRCPCGGNQRRERLSEVFR